MSSVALLLAWFFVTPCVAAGFQEDFASDPAAAGWHVFGDSDLFHWDPAGEVLEMTWDSARPNSFFYHALETTLTKRDDFEWSFDLELREVQVGTNPNRPFTFELAIGFINLREATSANFIRGTGTQSPDLVELDYFPDSGFGATISPALVSSNSQFVPSFTFPLELTTGDMFHVQMQYTATNQTLATVMQKNGQPFGPIKSTTLSPSFTDFRVDTFAVSSYSDAEADGSLLARGAVDNLAVSLPSAPISTIQGAWTTHTWRVQFKSQASWNYTLERSEDFTEWRSVSETLPGTDGTLTLIDTSPPSVPAWAFYRVCARKP